MGKLPSGQGKHLMLMATAAETIIRKQAIFNMIAAVVV
jgi:hypothetical protein